MLWVDVALEPLVERKIFRWRDSAADTLHQNVLFIVSLSKRLKALCFREFIAWKAVYIALREKAK